MFKESYTKFFVLTIASLMMGVIGLQMVITGNNPDIIRYQNALLENNHNDLDYTASFKSTMGFHKAIGMVVGTEDKEDNKAAVIDANKATIEEFENEKRIIFIEGISLGVIITIGILSLYYFEGKRL